jgi:glucokinase
MLFIDQDGTVVYRKKTTTPRPSLPGSVIQSVKEMLKEASSELGLPVNYLPDGIGLCMAGFTETSNGIVHQAPNLDWHQPVPLKKMMEESFSTSVLIENDTNAAVIGEVYFGAAQGHNHAIYITISTGIGGGLFLDGRLYRGSFGFAGEVGHIKPYGKGRTCKCGGENCLEIWASGSAIARSARSLIDSCDPGDETIDTKRVFEEADRGNELAAAVIEDAAMKTGIGLANLINLLNPSCIVIGGGVAGGRPDYLERIKSYVYKNAIRPSVDIASVSLVPAALEPEAGIWGMYAFLTGKAVG